MPTESYIALVRAVNLGPHRRIGMTDLRELVAAVCFADSRTLANSGNVVFRGPVRSTAKIERQLEMAAKQTLHLDASFMVRTSEEWEQVVDGNPFRSEAANDPSHLLVLVLKDAVEAVRVRALQSAIAGGERVRGSGRHVYAVYPDGIGRSKLTNAVIEKQLGVPATGRNWNTVLRLKELACV